MGFVFQIPEIVINCREDFAIEAVENAYTSSPVAYGVLSHSIYSGNISDTQSTEIAPVSNTKRCGDVNSTPDADRNVRATHAIYFVSHM